MHCHTVGFLAILSLIGCASGRNATQEAGEGEKVKLRYELPHGTVAELLDRGEQPLARMMGVHVWKFRLACRKPYTKHSFRIDLYEDGKKKAHWLGLTTDLGDQEEMILYAAVAPLGDELTRAKTLKVSLWSPTELRRELPGGAAVSGGIGGCSTRTGNVFADLRGAGVRSGYPVQDAEENQIGLLKVQETFTEDSRRLDLMLEVRTERSEKRAGT